MNRSSFLSPILFKLVAPRGPRALLQNWFHQNTANIREILTIRDVIY